MLTKIAGKIAGVAFCEQAGNDQGGGGGGGETSWRDGLPEDLRDNASLVDFKDINGLAKSFVDTKSALGNAIRIPGEGAGAEDRTEFTNKLLSSAPNLMVKPDFENAEQTQEFYRSVGMPEESTGYEVPTVEGLEYPEERQTVLREAAHKAGISKAQFSTVMQAAMEADAALITANKQATAEAMKGLKDEWGMDFDNRYQGATLIAEKTGAPVALVEAIKAKQTGPEVVKWLHGLVSKFGSEGQEILNQGDTDTSGKAIPAEAKAQISEIMSNKKHPYWVAHDPGHADAIKKMIELQGLANPQNAG